MSFPWSNGDVLDAADLNAAIHVGVVDAGTNLSVARPAGYLLVIFRFDAGVVTGASGQNIVNAQPGDLFIVASA